MQFWYLRHLRSKQFPIAYSAQDVPRLSFVGFNDIVVLSKTDSRASYIIAKTAAAAWYLTAHLSCIKLVEVGGFYVVKGQMSIGWILEFESKEAVGQWSTWVTLLLGILASVIRTWTHPKPNQRRCIKLIASSDTTNLDARLVAQENKSRAEATGNMTQLMVSNCVYEWQDSKGWWLNPTEASQTQEGKNSEKLQDEVYVWEKFSSSGEGLPLYHLLPRNSPEVP